MPFVLFEQDLAKAGANSVESAFIRSRVFTVDRVLSSKIVEYGNLCAAFLKDVDETSDPLLLSIAKDYEPISKEIRSAKWTRILRNTASFHYDQKHALNTLANAKDDEPLQFTRSELKGVTHFDFAENLISSDMLEYAGSGDTKVGIDVVNQFIKTLVFSIMDFHARTTKEIFVKNGILLDCDIGELRPEYCANIGDFHIPLVPLWRGDEDTELEPRLNVGDTDGET